jgi:hypothetical protein
MEIFQFILSRAGPFTPLAFKNLKFVSKTAVFSAISALVSRLLSYTEKMCVAS